MMNFFKTYRTCFVVLVLAAAFSPRVVGTIEPFETNRVFTFTSNATAFSTNVPDNETWVLENVSGRLQLPAGKHITNINLFQQAPDASSSMFLYLVPSLVSTGVSTANGSVDIYLFNLPVHAYYTNQVEFNLFTDSTSGGTTTLNFSAIGYLIPTLSGDFNANGIVDAADYAIYRNTLGQSGTGLFADANNNNLVETGDYNTWTATFGNSLTPAAAAATAAPVPEPAALYLTLIAATLLAATRSPSAAKRA